jgi:hypothetical protein
MDYLQNYGLNSSFQDFSLDLEADWSNSEGVSLTFEIISRLLWAETEKTPTEDFRAVRVSRKSWRSPVSHIRYNYFQVVNK